MKPRILRTTVLLSLIALAACATTAEFQRGIDQFLGQPISVAKEILGFDYAVTPLEEGERAYTWTSVRTGRIPGYQAPTTYETTRTRHKDTVTSTTTVTPGAYFPPERFRDICAYTLVADRSDTILRWSARGDACKGWPPTGQLLRSTPATPQ